VNGSKKNVPIASRPHCFPSIASGVPLVSHRCPVTLASPTAVIGALFKKHSRRIESYVLSEYRKK